MAGFQKHWGRRWERACGCPSAGGEGAEGAQASRTAPMTVGRRLREG